MFVDANKKQTNTLLKQELSSLVVCPEIFFPDFPGVSPGGGGTTRKIRSGFVDHFPKLLPLRAKIGDFPYHRGILLLEH